MKNHEQRFFPLKLLTTVTVCLLMFAPMSMAAIWTLDDDGNGECYKGEKRAGGAKYCNNCKNQGGNQIKWTFTALCDGNQAGKVETSLTCGTSVKDEGEQLRVLRAGAKKSLPSATTPCP